MEHLKDTFVHEVNDLYDAEHRVLEMLETLLDKVESPHLKEKLEEDQHLIQRKLERLEQMEEATGEEITRERCKGMIGLLEEVKKAIKESEDIEVCEAALIGAYQKVKHYGIAGYGTLRSYSKLLNYEKATRLLSLNLRDDKKIDRELTQIAVHEINENAV